MSNTPIEEFAEARRSGKYHPDTLKNWPEKEESARPVQDSPINEEKPENVRINTNDTFDLAFKIIIVVWLLILSIIIYKIDSKSVTASVPFKEAPPKVIVKTKVKKVLIADGSDKWRRKLCYGYGDWSACLAYKTGLPWRARVGREDL